MKTDKGFVKQHGDSLLFALFVLLLMTLGLLATMRVVQSDGQASGAMDWHMRAKQVSEIFLRQTINDIATAVTTNGPDLTTASGTWFRDGTTPSVPTVQSDWETCASSTTTSTRCERQLKTYPGSGLKFYVYRIVQAMGTTAVSVPSGLCDSAQAKYYRISIHVVEASVVDSSTAKTAGSQMDAEGIYRLCI